MKNNIKLLGGIAAATFGALLLAPQSGWLIRAQMRGAVGQSPYANYTLPSSAQEEQAQRAMRIAADPKNRNDVGLQMAARERMGFAAFSKQRQADRVTNPNWHVDGLRPLLNDPDFGSRPELWATVLRYMTQESVRLDNRIETQLLTEPKPRPASQIADVQTKPNPHRNTPTALLEWDNLCREGARLDPDNSYFPMMRAVGFFAARKDDQAVAAFIEASQKSHYNDYSVEETQGALRLNAQINGKTGYLSDLAVSSAASYPNYSQMRSAGELAIVYAMRRELAGQPEEGFAVRQAVLRAGALMRVGSTSVSGGWTGDRMVRWTPARPGGALPLPKNPDEPYTVRTQKNRARFSAYLTRIGHEDADTEYRYEIAAGDKHRTFWSRAENDPNNVLQLAPAYHLINWWALGVGVLTNLLVLLVLGGVCAFAARTRHIREGLPLSTAARNGAASALVAPVFGLGIALTWPELPAQILTAVTSGGLAVVLFRAFRHAARLKQAAPETGQAIGKSSNVRAFCGALGVALLGLLALGILPQTGAPQMLRSAGAMMGLRAEEYNPLKVFANGLLGVGAASGVSLLLGLGLTIVSRVRRVPVSVGVVRGVRRLALPVASLLVFVYAGVALQTLREEARAESALQMCLRDGEAAYLAGLLHETPPVAYRDVPAAQKIIVTNSYNGPLSGIPGKATSKK